MYPLLSTATHANMSPMDVNVKHRYLTISVSYEKIAEAFATICDDAHDNADGNAEDLILLSYHQCPELADDKKFIESQALLKHLEMAELQGVIQSDFPFSLQSEYTAFLEQRQVESEIDENLEKKYDVPRNRIE